MTSYNEMSNFFQILSIDYLQKDNLIGNAGSLFQVAANKNSYEMYNTCMTDLLTRVNIEKNYKIECLRGSSKCTIDPYNLDLIDQKTIEMINLIRNRVNNIISKYDNITTRIKNIPSNIKINTTNIIGNGKKQLDEIIEQCNMAETILLSHTRKLNFDRNVSFKTVNGIPKSITFRRNMSNPIKIVEHKEDSTNINMFTIISRIEKLARNEPFVDDPKTPENIYSIDKFGLYYYGTNKNRQLRTNSAVIVKILHILYGYWDINHPEFKIDPQMSNMLDNIFTKLIIYYKNGGRHILPNIFNQRSRDFTNADETLQKIIFLLQFGPLCRAGLEDD